MSSFTFHEGLPQGLKSDFDPGIFHDPKHLSLQSSTGWHSFYCKNEETLAGLIHVHVNSGFANSPYKSPFGSFLFSEKLSETALNDFVSYCENQLADKKVKSITIKNQPEAYSLRNQMLFDVLDKLDYSIVKEETSAILSITENSFESGLHKSEKKRLRKCRESALSFEIMPAEQLQKIYVFLEACREEKDYSLSMPYDEIQKLAATFPERILLTVVIDNKNQIVAANISIWVYDNVLYNFYHDHAGEYDHLSPVVLLNEGLYNFCQKNKISLLDLGTSNIDDKVNESLLAFKLHLGAQPSRKLTFSKTLS